MKMENTAAVGGVEILATDVYQAIPVEVAGASVVKAGSPLTAAGTVADAAENAVGVLLYDVDPANNPNGALVVAGIVDWAKCMSHSGTALTAEAMKAALPAIEFRANIGVNA